MVRAETNCLTVAFCHDIHEDAMLSVQDLDVKQMDQIIEIFKPYGKTWELTCQKTGKSCA